MKIAVCSCLLGESCRYDGNHKKDDFIVKDLSLYFDFIPFCPELEAFGVPREPIELVADKNTLHVKGVLSKTNVIKKLIFVSKNIIQNIDKNELCGFILKTKSPSCGLKTTKIYNLSGDILCEKGMGIFTRLVLKKFNFIPIVEENEVKSTNFLMQIFALKSLHEFLQKKPCLKDLVAFHSSYKYFIYAKSQKYYKILGNIVANHEKLALSSILQNYKNLFIQAVLLKEDVKNTCNSLLHMYGYFKKQLCKDEKNEFLKGLEDYKAGKIPLAQVITYIRNYAIKYNQSYILQQKILDETNFMV